MSFPFPKLYGFSFDVVAKWYYMNLYLALQSLFIYFLNDDKENAFNIFHSKTNRKEIIQSLVCWYIYLNQNSIVMGQTKIRRREEKWISQCSRCT